MPTYQATSSPGKGRRMRLRGVFSGKRGRQIGMASFFLPLAGYVVQDLSKPDSKIKLIARRAYAYLAERKIDRAKQIDPAGRIEIIETEVSRDVPEKVD